MTVRDRDKQLNALDQAIIHTRRFYLTTNHASEVSAFADIALESLTKALGALRNTTIVAEREAADA